ncbi:MAG: hypothetical protein ACXW34_09750, partial [Nitrospira sp.]
MATRRGTWWMAGSSIVAIGMVALLPDFGVGGAAPQGQSQPQVESQGILLGLEDPAAYIPADNPQT